tara:strand:+ start:1985 stop:2230 length:246 start_codon:yes stop_codon:yes gene_type:complete
MKYYVESGDIKYIIQARNPMHACMRALNRESTKMRDVRLESNFFVSEKGFLSNRDVMTITIPEEQVLPTGVVLDKYNRGGY